MSVEVKDTVCLILARGGSKRVPRKNVRPLNGKPLVCYSFEAAIASGRFAEVVISTDDAEVAKLAEPYGIAVDWRPEHLCTDTIRAVEVIEEYLLRDTKNRKHVAMLLPTCPFRNALDVQYALEIYSRHEGRLPLMAVTQYDFPPQLAVSIAEGDDRILMREPDAYAATTRTQSIQPLYHPNGAIYLSSVESFIKRRTFFQEEMLSYVMPAERSFDIDYPYQMRIAEIMAIEMAESNDR